MQSKILQLLLITNAVTYDALTLYIMGIIGPTQTNQNEIEKAVQELEDLKEVIVIRYWDNTRVKFILFRKGTTFIDLESINAHGKDPNSKNRLAGSS